MQVVFDAVVNFTLPERMVLAAGVVTEGRRFLGVGLGKLGIFFVTCYALTDILFPDQQGNAAPPTSIDRNNILPDRPVLLRDGLEVALDKSCPPGCKNSRIPCCPSSQSSLRS